MKQIPNIFISHRHIDKPVADVFREAFVQWTDSATNVYQSSNATTASSIGANLDREVAKAISGSNLLLLIYTDSPGDLDWCMYECGLAQDPDNLDRTITMFHTTEEPPDPLDGLLAVRPSRDSIKQFVYNFHQRADFFYGLNEPLQPDITEELLEDRAASLYDALRLVIPSAIRDVPVYDRVTFGLSDEQAEKIIAAEVEGGLPAALEIAAATVPTHFIIRSFSGDPQEHFAYDAFTPDMTLEALATRWARDSAGEDDSWKGELCDSVAVALLNRPERSVSMPFKSLAGSQWLLPLLARFRDIAYEGVREFDVLFCKIDDSAARAMVASKR